MNTMRKNKWRVLAFVALFGWTGGSMATTARSSSQVEMHVDGEQTEQAQTKSVEAVRVMDFLKSIYGKQTLSGVTANVGWNLNEAKWVYQHTGKYPAMAFVDYVSLAYSPANWIDYSDISELETWWKANGLVGASWHWCVPCVEGSEDLSYVPGDGSIDQATGKRNTTVFSAARALKKGTWENRVMKADLKKLAGYLKLFRDHHIPVIWRPLHEAAGNIYNYPGGKAWFWWGADGADVYRQLWKYMFDYFEKEGLDNLIWVWTSQTKDEAFYPGDEYVDIIGRDIYPMAEERDTPQYMTGQFETLTKAWPSKPVALTECGKREGVEWLENISTQWKNGARWLFFMPWYDYNRTLNPDSDDFNQKEHQFADISWWNDALKQPYVLTRDQMPSFKTTKNQ